MHGAVCVPHHQKGLVFSCYTVFLLGSYVRQRKSIALVVRTHMTRCNDVFGAASSKRSVCTRAECNAENDGVGDPGVKADATAHTRVILPLLFCWLQ